MPPHEATEILQEALECANLQPQSETVLSNRDLQSIKRIMDRVADNKNKAVLAVLITLIVKKIMNPDQDIRLHRIEGTLGGFSGRGLDTKYITPFLRDNNFPYMASGSGWLTRSFEQAAPYTFTYPCKIKPLIIKDDFLNLVDRVQNDSRVAKEYLYEFLRQLISLREQSQNITLSKPKNRSIADVVSLIKMLWNQALPGQSRIPVIAVFAAYMCLIDEVDRFKNNQLLPLLPHTSADQKTGRAGDIDICQDSKTVEAVEIKHGIKINIELVSATIEKVKRTTVKRYYILSTNDVIEGIDDITRLITEARINHGCEFIVNGVASTLRYYLRLISNVDEFVESFISLLEKDNDVGYQTKMAWDNIVVNDNLEQ